MYAYVDARKKGGETTWFKQQKSLHNLRRKIRFAMPRTPLKDIMLEDDLEQTPDIDDVLTMPAEVEKLGGDVSDESEEDLSTTSNCMRSCIHNVKSYEDISECYKIHKSESTSTIHVVEVHQEDHNDIDCHNCGQKFEGSFVDFQFNENTSCAGMQELPKENDCEEKNGSKDSLCRDRVSIISHVTHL